MDVEKRLKEEIAGINHIGASSVDAILAVYVYANKMPLSGEAVWTSSALRNG
ncbi:hypothetical protein AWB68_06365 [Caballeronia choica]|uniref:Uncharacterized protein n=2 Tax=Caballeronia choica TaxID=326476 RepID=A0A158KMR9_9BURK|nr:hypothetical protein AWB68_06365 [Caballeronia choica]